MQTNADYARCLGRASVGALLFALPLFMTMELWELGFTADKLRIAALLAVTAPLLVGLSYVAGFERAFGLVDHLLDAFAAFLIAAIVGALALVLFGVVRPGQPPIEILSKIALVTFPAALGALLADKQLGRHGSADADADRAYVTRLFLMAVGALFVALNVAPTEEMVLIAEQISPLQAALLAIVSLALLHALLFWVDFAESGPNDVGGFWSVLMRYSVAGYAICALVSLFLLWVFDRTDGVPLSEMAEYVAVLSFASVLGAGLALLWWPSAVAKRASSADAPLLEWATGVLGALVFVALLGVLVSAGLTGADAPPNVRTRVERILPVTGGYVVEFVVENAGDQPAADIEIIAALGPEEARACFDYLPPHSRRRGGVFLRSDPRAGNLTLRADGYADP